MNLATGTNYINSFIKQASDSVRYQQMGNTSSQVELLAGDIGAEAKIKEVSENFESQLLGQLMGFMFDTVEVDRLFGGGFAEETLRSLMVDEYGKIISKSGGVGIAEQVQKTLLNLQVNQG